MISHCKYSRESERLHHTGHCIQGSSQQKRAKVKEWRMGKKGARWANWSPKSRDKATNQLFNWFMKASWKYCYFKVYIVSKTRKLQKSFPSIVEGHPKLTRLRTYQEGMSISEGKVSAMSAAPSSLAGKVDHSHFQKLVSSLVKTALGS